MDALLAYRWPGNIRELKNVIERVVLKTGGRVIRPVDLPTDVVRAAVAQPSPSSAGGATAAGRPSQADELAALDARPTASRSGRSSIRSSWRATSRAPICARSSRSASRHTNGNYRSLVQQFNMSSDDYKRFLSFLRKHDCHLPFQRFRAAPARLHSQPQTTGALAKA